MTNSIRVDLKLPTFILDTDTITTKTTYSFIFDYEVLVRMKNKFDDFDDIVSFTDGSSIKNPGRVSL